jgi:hypothetical protein
MDFRLVCIFASPEIQLPVASLSTPNKIWTKLDILFGIKEDYEECMLENDMKNPTKNPLEE